LQHRQKLLALSETSNKVMEKLAVIFTRYDQPNKDDPDLTLYSGNFASDRDRNTMESMQRSIQSGAPPTADQNLFEDKRHNEICFRLSARNWPDNLNAANQKKWKTFCHQRVHEGRDGFRSIVQYRQLTEDLAKTAKTAKAIQQVEKLAAYGEEIAKFSSV